MIYFIGIESKSIALGVKYCTNRPTGLYSCLMDGKDIARIPHVGNARFPRLAPDSKSIIFLSNSIGGAHAACSKLLRYDLVTRKISTVVDVVYTPKENDHFPGIYSQELVPQCFFQKSPCEIYVFTASAWRSQTVILAIEVCSGKLRKITPNTTDSWSLHFATKDGWLVGSRSNFNNPGSLMILNFSMLSESDLPISEGSWIEIDCFSVPHIIAQNPSLFEISKIPNRSNFCEVIFVKSSTISSPLIVYPHGGPHGSFDTSYAISIAGFVALGFSCLLVNYTGSIGFGEDSIQSLIGQIGSLDVEDVHSAAIWASKQSGIDPKKVFIYGGSHGGFLTGYFQILL